MSDRIPHRQFCSMCHGPCVVDFWVPDEIFQAALHIRWWNDLVCIICFARHADEKLIEWCRDIKLFPASMARQVRIIEAAAPAQGGE